MKVEFFTIIGISAFFVFLYACAIAMLCGKCGLLNSGYHFSPKSPRAQKYHKTVMRGFGTIFLFLSVITHAALVFACLKIYSAMYSALIGGIVYLPENKKFKYARQKEAEEETLFEEAQKKNQKAVFEHRPITKARS